MGRRERDAHRQQRPRRGAPVLSGFEYSDDLDIVIVEGETPGSSYFAAELHGDIDDANERAESLGLPIRFVYAEA